MPNVFEAETTVKKWDDDYYTPISVKLYDKAVVDMLKAMDVPAGSEVLDAGCGPGVHSIRIAKAGHPVHAIDISSKMLEHARERVNAAGLGGKVRFTQMDLTNLPIPDASVTHAMSWGVIIHIPQAQKAFSELARVMRRGGRLGLYLTNASAFDHKLERVARSVLRKPVVAEHSDLGDGARYMMNGEELWVWQFDPARLIENMKKIGFELKFRRSGEFSEIQRRVKGPVRNALLHLNNLAYAANVPASIAVSNIYVFERI